MKNKATRALRRHHRVRMTFRAYRLLKNREYTCPIDTERLLNWAKRRCDHFTNCSCTLCGNPRSNPYTSKKLRATLQERRADETWREEWQELS